MLFRIKTGTGTPPANIKKGDNMKYLLLLCLLAAGPVMARDVYVQPHIRSDGTYVQGYHRTAPDSNPFNNYSTQGNVNPYTGQPGTVNPYQQPQIQTYPQQQQRCHRDVYGSVSCY